MDLQGSSRRPKATELEPHHQIDCCALSRILIGESYFSAEIQRILLYPPTWLLPDRVTILNFKSSLIKLFDFRSVEIKG